MGRDQVEGFTGRFHEGISRQQVEMEMGGKEEIQGRASGRGWGR